MSIRLGGALRELRIHLCQTSAPSAGVREFIQANYVNIKKENPKFPILIRECNGIQPRVWARFDKGYEVSESLSGLNSDEVCAAIQRINKGVERSTPLTNLKAGDVLSAIKQLIK